ncbi:hypothetical protein JST97_09335 [bacterium]|nr:hypothetical protein [bacterium]
MAVINTEQRTSPVQRLQATQSAGFNPFERLRQAANEALGGLVGTAPTAPVVPPYDKKVTQARLDDFRNSMRSTYTIPSDTPGEAPRTVKVFPQFQMEGGLSDPEGKEPSKGRINTMAKVGEALPEIKQNPALRSAASAAGMGRATPEQLKLVTQALIDAGKLPPASGDHTTDSARVRKLQWEFGLGSDCAGYVAQAASKAAGRDLGLGGVNRNGDSLQQSLSPEQFSRVPQQAGKPIRARAGDIIRLTDPSPGEAGHWVSVYDHTTMSADKVAKLHNSKNEFWQGSGHNAEVHVYTLDSSWGAGGDWKTRSAQNEVGGVDRRKWVYNAANDRWGTYDDRAKNPTIEYSEIGPYNHLPDVKVYRPKSAEAQ